MGEQAQYSESKKQLFYNLYKDKALVEMLNKISFPESYERNISEMAYGYETRDFLDYGCGNGMLEHQLPFYVNKYDPFVEKYSIPPKPADIVICVNVLQCIEKQYIDSVLNDIASLMKRAAFFVVDTCKSGIMVNGNEDMYCTTMNTDFWCFQLLKHFSIRKLSHDGKVVQAICEPLRESKEDILQDIQSFHLHKSNGGAK
ncbi:MAG: hypothetical protein KAS32_09940 [Candidatus Peribacteraceae bacterium]|nr:hypothetical protein [Candidatus Peribacteraceae bacterium]